MNVSPSTFDEMVKSGRMPKPKQLTGKRVAWDLSDLNNSVDQLPTVGADTADDTWDD